MRLSDEQREKWLNDARLTQSHGYVGHPMERGEIIIGLGKLALDLADELAAMREEAETQFMANADVIRNHEQTRKELAASQRREKRLKRQVELMGWLMDSRGDEVDALRNAVRIASYRTTGELNRDMCAALSTTSFSDMSDPSDEGEYTDDDLDMLKDHWPAAREELLRRQMAADNADHRDDAARQAWEESR